MCVHLYGRYCAIQNIDWQNNLVASQQRVEERAKHRYQVALDSLLDERAGNPVHATKQRRSTARKSAAANERRKAASQRRQSQVGPHLGNW